MLVHKCESCVHGMITKGIVTKYRNYPYGKYEVESLQTTCRLTMVTKRLLIRTCKRYKPKPQKVLKVSFHNDKKNVKVKQEGLKFG